MRAFSFANCLYMTPFLVDFDGTTAEQSVAGTVNNWQGIKYDGAPIFPVSSYQWLALGSADVDSIFFSADAGAPTRVFTPRTRLKNLLGVLGGETGASDYTPYIALTDDTLPAAIFNYFRSDKDGALKKYGPIEQWNTSSVTTIAGLFSGLGDVPIEFIGSWDLSNVTNMDSAFSNCIINMSQLCMNTGKVKSMNSTFAYSILNGLPDNAPVGVSECIRTDQHFYRWNLPNVTSIKSCFEGCTINFEPTVGIPPALWATTDITKADATDFKKDAQINVWIVDPTTGDPETRLDDYEEYWPAVKES